jgi:hypothetical protein
MSTNVNLQEENAALRSALEAAMQGINDWLHLYAPDECREDRVAEAKKRVHEHGTLAYIAGLNEKAHKALATKASEPSVPASAIAPLAPFLEMARAFCAYRDKTGVYMELQLNPRPRTAINVGHFRSLLEAVEGRSPPPASIQSRDDI